MKPKLIFCLALVLSGGLFGCCNIPHQASEPSTLKVMIDIPDYSWNGKPAFPRSLLNRYKDAHFFVVLENMSSQILFLRGMNDQIGDLSFEITDEDGKKIVVHRSEMDDEKNVSREWRLMPGQATVQEIYYDRDWEKFPFPDNDGQRRKVTIRAVFEQKIFKDAMPPATWAGRIVSEPYEVILENDAL
jgi:hypothetical protein